MVARAPARSAASRRIRYAVVGQGYIAQVAVLPAFAHARRNSELAAILSDDPVKLRSLGRRYGVRATYRYEGFEECLAKEQIDAVFTAPPHDLHREYTERAAGEGVHVLCEKPMALTEKDCESMMRVARDNSVKLMIGYRLHFEKANLAAVQVARSGRIGEPRIFNSTFTTQVREGNTRLRRARGGGPLYDIGIYCINAARYLFNAEPVEVTAFADRGGERRFREVEECASAVLRFPGARLATFTCSFGASDVAEYRIVGTRGDLRVEPAYEHAEGLKHHLTIGGRGTTRSFPHRDQFAAELLYFSDCIRKDREPEPSGREGLADIRVLQAIRQSARTGTRVALAPFRKTPRPTPDQEITRPPSRKPPLVHARSPHPPSSSQ